MGYNNEKSNKIGWGKPRLVEMGCKMCAGKRKGEKQQESISQLFSELALAGSLCSPPPLSDLSLPHMQSFIFDLCISLTIFTC